MSANGNSVARRTAERLLLLAVPVAAAAGLGLLVGHLVNEYALDGRVEQLAASNEYTVWTWAASMATFAAALGAAFIGFARGRAEPLGLAALLVFLALDDFVVIHDPARFWTSSRRAQLGEGTPDALGLRGGVGPGLWTPLYVPLLALVVLLGWRIARQLGARERRTIVAGAALLAAGFALGVVGIATKRLEESGRPTAHFVRAGLEDATELAGWILVACGLAAGAVSSAPAPRSGGSAPRPMPEARFRRVPSR